MLKQYLAEIFFKIMNFLNQAHVSNEQLRRVVKAICRIGELAFNVYEYKK